MSATNQKIKVATGHLQGCFGCHIAILDLHEDIIGVLQAIDIVRSPINDVKDVIESALGILDGSICNTENEKVAKRFRERSDKILAFGTCASFGGIQGLRNLYPLKKVLERGYIDAESTVNGKIPSSEDIPKILPHVKSIDQVIKVDYYLPGCPPTPGMIGKALGDIFTGKEPELPTRNLCHECVREHKEMYIPRREFITENVTTLMELEHIDSKKCFLEQGILCMGPATREGCDSRCVKGNTPCRGCMGPTPDALEQGAKMINALATILPAGGLMFMEDVVGVGYRYALPVSIYPYVKEEK
jgi:F420-non-reducing hydrogenase small subunit